MKMQLFLLPKAWPLVCPVNLKSVHAFDSSNHLVEIYVGSPPCLQNLFKLLTSAYIDIELICRCVVSA